MRADYYWGCLFILVATVPVIAFDLFAPPLGLLEVFVFTCLWLWVTVWTYQQLLAATCKEIEEEIAGRFDLPKE